VRGYARLTLSDDAGALPFSYVGSHVQYVNQRPAQIVRMAPGAHAFVLIAKYRCDLGDSRHATRLALSMPGSTVALSLPLPSVPGVSVLAYCKGEPDDPGQMVGQTPFEPDLEALFPSPSPVPSPEH
jgi:hypothetical protein